MTFSPDVQFQLYCLSLDYYETNLLIARFFFLFLGFFHMIKHSSQTFADINIMTIRCSSQCAQRKSRMCTVLLTHRFPSPQGSSYGPQRQRQYALRCWMCGQGPCPCGRERSPLLALLMVCFVLDSLLLTFLMIYLGSLANTYFSCLNFGYGCHGWVTQPTSDPLVFWPPVGDNFINGPFNVPLPPDAYAMSNISHPISGLRK